MKNFWFCMFLAIACGTACAWAINYKRYGHREARFGPFSMDRDVTPVNASEMLESQVPAQIGHAEFPAGIDHDFGVMPPGSKGEHTFIVKNVGKGDLKLRVGASSCKCTFGSLENDSLAPGEQTDVKLEWKIPPNPSSPEFSQNAQLLTNDPVNYGITLSISGKIIGDMEAVPVKWSFGEVAAGESFDFTGNIFSFYDDNVVPTEMRFSDEELNEFAHFEVEPFDPTAEDGIYEGAKQAFRVNIHVDAGLRQGAVSQNFLFGFRQKGQDGEQRAAVDGDTDESDYLVTSVTGRIVGALGMITSARVEGKAGGGYLYDFGRIGAEDSLVGKSFVVLKGNDRDNTKLNIGEVSPAGVLKARLGEPRGRGSMTLYPLEIEVVPGDEPIARLGKSKDDYGNVWIESDNPKVTKMRIAVKFAVDPR